MDIFGWIVVGLLTSVTGELILPGRNPAGIGVSLLLGAAGSRSDAVRRRGDTVGRPGSVRSTRALSAGYESSSTVGGARSATS